MRPRKLIALSMFALAGGLTACGSSPDDPGNVPPDASGDGGSDPGDGGVEPPASPRVLYGFDRRHSPITRDVMERLRAIASASSGDQRVFAKVGDSMTYDNQFLRCFDGGNVDLGERVGLRPTIEYYLAGDADGSSPFARNSISAFNGATAEAMLADTPSRLERELAEIRPLLGVVMLGTNESRRGVPLDTFARNLWTIIDRMLEAGTIPLVSTIPANTSDAWADVQIPRFNLAIRGIAQGRQIPFVDLHRTLNSLPNRGISNDGVHLSVAPGGGCLWTASGLQHGYNTRNLVTIESLYVARLALEGTPSDDAAITLAGSGTPDDPYLAPWPFADIADTRRGEATITDHGCPGGRAQPGKELVYHFDLPRQVRLHAQVITRGSTDVDLQVIVDGACRARGDDSVTVTVGPGPIQIIVDTPVDDAEGEFLLVAGPRVNPPS
jgi:hypothetical protein